MHSGAFAFETCIPASTSCTTARRRVLEYDVVVAPGGDPSRIRLQLEGALSVRTDEDGDLVLETTIGQIRYRRPNVFQARNGRRIPVAARYRADRTGEVSFEVSAYDRTSPLVVDPVLDFGAILGSSFDDTASHVATDTAGNIYVAGSAGSFDFPTTVGLLEHGAAANDAFVAKLDPSGTSLRSVCYVGGNDDDRAFGLSVDAAGCAYVVGTTLSSDFPTIHAIQSTPPPAQQNGDAFALKLTADFSALVYSTYLGGQNAEFAVSVAIDDQGCAYVAGWTASPDFPTANAFDPVLHGDADAFVAKIAPSGSSLVYSTYFGGGGEDFGAAVAVDSSGAAYFTGSTSLTTFDQGGVPGPAQTSIPLANPAQLNRGGSGDAFVAKLAPSGNSLVYSTYLGGRGSDNVSGIVIDQDGCAYVCGDTLSSDFPLSGHAEREPLAYADGFVTKLSPSGSSFVFTSIIAGSREEKALGIALAQGSVLVTGRTGSTDLPTLEPLQASYGGGSFDGFVAQISSATGAVLLASYLGGPGLDTLESITVDGTGGIIVSGSSTDTAFLASSNVVAGPGGRSDIVVARFFVDDSGAIPIAPSGVQAAALDSSRVEVGWTDNSTNETAFRIERRMGLGGPWEQIAIAPADSTSTMDMGLSASTDYTYRVRATTGPEDSAVSNESAVTTPAGTGAPNAPSSLGAAAVSGSEIVLGWLDNSSDEMGFEVERSDSGGASWSPLGTTGADIGTFRDSGLSTPVEHSYRVRASTASARPNTRTWPSPRQRRCRPLRRSSNSRQ